jgi:hypothetical protein
MTAHPFGLLQKDDRSASFKPGVWGDITGNFVVYYIGVEVVIRNEVYVHSVGPTALPLTNTAFITPSTFAKRRVFGMSVGCTRI